MSEAPLRALVMLCPLLLTSDTLENLIYRGKIMISVRFVKRVLAYRGVSAVSGVTLAIRAILYHKTDSERKQAKGHPCSTLIGNPQNLSIRIKFWGPLTVKSETAIFAPAGKVGTQWRSAANAAKSKHRFLHLNQNGSSPKPCVL